MSNKNVPDFDFDYSKNKQKLFEYYCKYMFTRTQSMFVYDGLPDTIPSKWLEKYLQRNGSCGIIKHNGDLYAVIGNAGGEYDAYYQPTIYTVANPWLNISKTFEIGKDCVYARNDYEGIGLTPLISRYCGLMTENALTVRLADIGMRMVTLLAAPDDNTAASARKYLSDLEGGCMGVIGENAFFDGLKVHSKSTGGSDYMIQFIELQQYLKGSLYNEIGINANFNMKREALSGKEVSLNDDALMPLIDDMLKARREMCDEINEMFGTNISVDYGSTWHSNVVEKELIAESDLGGSSSEGEEVGGNENTLNEEGEPVSRLTDKPDAAEESEESEDSVESKDTEESEGTDESDDSEKSEDVEKSEDSEESEDSAESKETEENDVSEESEETDDKESGGEESGTDEPDNNEEEDDDEHDDRDVYGHKRR
jgi:hypothetical protein